jgi:CBS domain-containing protein/gamma-glutamyl:cysteine ligase YbdK (ATP-grasp superfamily)
MGNQQVQDGITGEQLRLFMRSLLDDLRALDMMIEEGRIESDVRRIGAEQEMFLIGPGFRPAPLVMEMIEGLKDPHFTTELAQFNLETNMEPLSFGGRCLSEMEERLSELVGKARDYAATLGAEIALVGILPTLRKSDLGLENMAPVPRYFALNQAMNRLRGGAYEFQIKGIDELIVKHDSVMVESCNTSFQVHFQVGAKEFAKLYNIAQAVAGPVLAAATNSPLLFGRRLWRETRIALFQQAVDTRSSSHHLRERQPRVSFGRNWVRESVVELFQEDIARFKILIGGDLDEDPFAVLRQGKVPQLKALRLHNGTVYRWNRPCYGITDGKPHLRIENRYIPSGPTLRDEVANGALWFGLVCALAREIGDVTRYLDFEQAKSNFIVAARNGLASGLMWLEGKEVPARDLLLDELIPLARKGLQNGGIAAEDIDLYLGVIEERVRTKQTGSQWFHLSLAGMKGKGTEAERMSALTASLVRQQKEGKPVSAWKLATLDEAGGWKEHYTKVEQFMSTDLFTVQEDEPIDLVASLMDWEKIRHVPVEDHEHRLVGLVSYRSLIHLLAQGELWKRGAPVPVSDVMKKDLITVAPETTTQEAILLMKERRIGSLPVVKDGRLIGIVTERDFMDIAFELLEEKLND